MYLYEKRETLTLVDFNSVMFIHTTGVTNPMMVVSIFLNIERLHAMIRQLESAAFQPKSQKENSVSIQNLNMNKVSGSDQVAAIVLELIPTIHKLF
nr:unnamed protein product [Callosobruchus analis]